MWGEEYIKMKNLRKYGIEPFRVVAIHGGPGAPGEMAPVARKLSSMGGVLEPLQTAKTIQGQLVELEEIVTKKGNPPVTLIGWSWGAWLGFIFAAQNTALVKKLILIASGPFEEKYAQNIMKIRLDRLGDKDRSEVLFLINKLEEPAVPDKEGNKNIALMRLGKLISKADSFDPLPHGDHVLGCQHDIFQNVWGQAIELRRSGRLLGYGKKIKCPVIAVHGDYDPHPAEGVSRPLSRILKDFRFILLEKCGHTPWIERLAKKKFYELIMNELV
jgi:pimeloyl-ACP methyl ester carboxylesterase